MKKIFGWIKDTFVGIAGNVLLQQIENVAEEEIDKWYKEDPEACIAAIKGAYAMLPLLKRLTDRTTAKWDDKIAAEVKAELEGFAAKYGITL